jgi:hypothetical protein
MTMTPCETCRFWVRADPSRDHGYCFRYPPQENDSGVSATYRGCGEHQPRAAAPAPEAETGALREALERLTKAADVVCFAYGNLPSNGKGDTEYLALCDAIGRARTALSATPARPAMTPETRQVLEDAAADLDFRGTEHRKAQAAAIRAHLAAHGGGDD